ncbi:hypothetical protein BV22DRAFT_1042555 [Leucogyrophana mollusca]|uniref:Uncharacterized protein n=1 Tax=Leucogyrophana mollusca TaxID=85980 RepID=A0ACB8C085_9AGAM|nr:hypothetical protein BV22DRAFT_1042555 [Leucogyrophana mollusca]
MSTRNKRKWQDLDDSDDEEPSFGKQILPVANLPEDFDQEPLDGMQYLFMVRRDARTLPHVTRVANPYEVLAPPVPQGNSLVAQTACAALPSEEWRAIFEKNFRNFRKNISQPSIRVHIDPSGSGYKIMPDKKERDLWWKFLAGQPETEWDPPKKPKQVAPSRKRHFSSGMRAFGYEDPELGEYDSDQEKGLHETWRINPEGEMEIANEHNLTESLPTPSGTPPPTDSAVNGKQPEFQAGLAEPVLQGGNSESVQGYPSPLPREPTPTLLRKIDHRMSVHLLMYFTHWINIHLQQPTVPSCFIQENHARWIFALLAKVDDHLFADDMSLLRNLARACLGVLKELIQKDSTPASQAGAGPSATGQNNITKVSSMKASSCWVIFTAIASGWGQRDLWMDAESVLASN